MAISDLKLYCNIIFMYTYYTLESNFYGVFPGVNWSDKPSTAICLYPGIHYLIDISRYSVSIL